MKRDAEKMEKEEYDKNYELTLEPGGFIHQAILRDHFHKDRYDEKNIVMFNVQFLAPKTFHLVTGTPPPQIPVSAETYARHGYPFFEMHNEPRAITGDFEELLKSVGDIDKEKNVNLKVHQQENGLHFRRVKLNTVDEMSHSILYWLFRRRTRRNDMSRRFEKSLRGGNTSWRLGRVECCAIFKTSQHRTIKID
ncbi:putative integral membrane protein [Botrytis fragariae]|uniref:Putative integral membrane protein n=1 Tax=Botrytis fragariae TaxID=1964551 RepID=A0A8H6AZF7_9HELO|nr:putative integral membrane protein [Botrytis fragariae]KAF5876608.1 putative integral membrane protein [Botrytis fragariae]